MAQSGLGTVVGLAAGVGLFFYAYEAGWLSSLGLGPSVAPVVIPTPAPAGTTVTTEVAGSAAGTNVVTPAGPCQLSGVLDPVLALVQAANPTMHLGPTGTDTFNMDQWNYYLDQHCSGLSSQVGLTPDAIFPDDPNRGGALNWNAYSGYARMQGLSGPRRIARNVARGRIVRRAGVACC